jgi:hypothetical protein
MNRKDQMNKLVVDESVEEIEVESLERGIF